jgi:aryl-alcohol dehydrogenase-like predicted oxidoreductase
MSTRVAIAEKGGATGNETVAVVDCVVTTTPHLPAGAMEELADKGLARNIGVSNFDTAGIRDLLSYARIPPAVLQVRVWDRLVIQSFADSVVCC